MLKNVKSLLSMVATDNIVIHLYSQIFVININEYTYLGVVFKWNVLFTSTRKSLCENGIKPWITFYQEVGIIIWTLKYDQLHVHEKKDYVLRKIFQYICYPVDKKESLCM